MNSDERCRHCGYLLDQHDWDGACPTCDDDAQLFAQQNEQDTTELRPVVTPLSSMLTNPMMRYELLSASEDIVRVWPVPCCCAPHTLIAQQVLKSYRTRASHNRS